MKPRFNPDGGPYYCENCHKECRPTYVDMGDDVRSHWELESDCCGTPVTEYAPKEKEDELSDV